MRIVKVTGKGQITLTVELRLKLRINKDDYLSVEAEGEVLTLREVRERKLLGSNDPIWEFIGKGSCGTWRRAENQRAIIKIVIFADDNLSVIPSSMPNVRIGSA